MLDRLRAWLNGRREYFAGVALYAECGDNAALLSLFKKGPTAYTSGRIQEELLRICLELKEQHGRNTVAPSPAAKKPTPESKLVSQLSAAPGGFGPNEPLYLACKEVADKAYKEVMNKRAVLFSLAPADDYTDPNTPERINAREALALAVVTGFRDVSALYEKADYVKLHGRLPHTGADADEGELAIPDHQVKQALDNLRKNINKMKKREQTPERIQLLQKHQETLNQLEARWHSLKLAEA